MEHKVSSLETYKSLPQGKPGHKFIHQDHIKEKHFLFTLLNHCQHFILINKHSINGKLCVVTLMTIKA